MKWFLKLDKSLRQYLLVTFNYWNFTITDGALRMLVVLYFYQLGYSPLNIALLFLFYEIFGVVTNLVGGWLGARIGLNRTMNIGLGMQVFALLLLTVPSEWLTIPWVMMAQAFSGIAKDLNKMSAKSSIKTLIPNNQQSKLYHWVAVLTGSKNALKGAGFFIGGLLSTLVGFQVALMIMAGVLAMVFVMSLLFLEGDLGKAKTKPKFSQMFSKSGPVNILSAARLFLFASRDVWFVVALPIYLASIFGWSHSVVGAFLASWVIAYGIVQGFAPKITAYFSKNGATENGTAPNGKSAMLWCSLLAVVTGILALAIHLEWQVQWIITIGLLIFGAIFAINSSLHSYLIISYAKQDGVSLDVGFYYMANAMGRLVGTVLSGWIYQAYGFAACLWIAFAFLLITSVISLKLPESSKV
ncbi:organoarsenical effux MFS transporter ArsJ [Psychromonas sp. SR45-3]|uniref:organoarsenical effux MFS transporter ArsJ n=1 Tax=Psychromonas sp. SR45-3 TaxID=2760930 RepID=UPI0015FE5880|nr:organoarsenical effux MFS transporter ArsJ [Psychromonas sp. SR45-3]MBB1273622.1 organoarsenical effux MFS transporter ArsJ [Psychromonas sp. SR45-3]